MGIFAHKSLESSGSLMKVNRNTLNKYWCLKMRTITKKVLFCVISGRFHRENFDRNVNHNA